MEDRVGLYINGRGKRGKEIDFVSCSLRIRDSIWASKLLIQTSMDRKVNDVASFLFVWNDLLVQPPIKGHIPELYFLFISCNKNRGKDKVSWIQFIKCLKSINLLVDQGIETYPEKALDLYYEDPFQCDAKIVYINRLSLNILFDSIKGERSLVTGDEELENNTLISSSNKISLSKLNKLDKLSLVNTLIDQNLTIDSLVPETNKDIYTTTKKSSRLQQINHLLDSNLASYNLNKEKIRSITSIVPFIDCCNDLSHQQKLISYVTYDTKTSYGKLSKLKFKKDLITQNNSLVQLSKCIMKKIHFVPIINSQTDIKLGDCSYLDTCHKMNLCRYIHYCQLMPINLETLGNNTQANNINNQFNIIEHNSLIEETFRINDYTKNDPLMNKYNELSTSLPQWINCDVRNLDFTKLGKFAAIIADPAWSIHMTLPYSSCDDNELLNLKLDVLQDEGIFLLWVTGRSIETGRSFLNKWGYKIVNQITWIKTNQLVRTITTGRTGHWLNHSKEHLIIGLKGEPKWLNKGIDPQLLISSTRETSRKPDEIYGIVERLVGVNSRKLEIFGRDHNTRKGWLTIGNQLNGTSLHEKELINNLDKMFVDR